MKWTAVDEIKCANGEIGIIRRAFIGKYEVKICEWRTSAVLASVKINGKLIGRHNYRGSLDDMRKVLPRRFRSKRL